MNISCIMTMVLTVLGSCICFELNCPDSSHRNLRSHFICNGTTTSKYYCLFDENRGRFVEQCKEKPDHVRPGEKYVITGRRRNVDCSAGTFQPFLFWSNASSDCVFIKSNCHEHGQVLYDNGSTQMDRSCRCDYTRGFDFIVKPNNPCYCIPSIEDCSCYKTTCVVTQKLTPDYECVNKDYDTFYSGCPLIIDNRPRTIHSTKHPITRYKKRIPESRIHTFHHKSNIISELEVRNTVKYGYAMLFCLTFIIVLICNRKRSDHTSSLALQSNTADETQNKLNMISEQVEALEQNQVSPIANRIGDTKNYVIRTVQERKSLFVETRAFEQIMNVLKEKHYVVIKGNPGDGKTTLALFALHKLISERCMRPLQLFNYSEWDKFVIPNKRNLAIFIDNFFGEFSISNDVLTEWRNRFSYMKANVSDVQNNMYIIIAIRNNIYNHSKRPSTREFLDPALVDISYREEFHLSVEEMEAIFLRYMPDKPFLPSKLRDKGPNIGFPECCRLLKENPSLEKNALLFFSSPLSFLKKELEERFMSNDMGMAVLVCVLLYGGKIKKDTLYDCQVEDHIKKISMSICSTSSDDVNALKDFRKSISTVEPSFITYDENDDTIKFAHSSIQIATFLVVGNHKTDELIKNCDYTLLSMITTSKHIIKDIESIQIQKNCYRILSERIRNLLLDPSFAVLNVISELPVWKDDNFFEECHYLDDLFLKAEARNGNSLFGLFAAAGCLKWVEYLYNKVLDQANVRQLEEALEESCGTNKEDIVTFLLEKKVQPTIKCCFNAVRAWRGENLNILNALAATNVDVNQLCNTQSHWKTLPLHTTVLDEAALLNQCNLIEPLLQLWPKLIDAKSANNATFIHSIARAGNVELLKKYIEYKSFSHDDKSDFHSTILHYACQSNRYDTVRYIRETYPDLFLPKHFCFSDGTVLHTAAQSGSINLFQYVIQQTKVILENNNIKSIQLDNNCFVYGADDEIQYRVESSNLLEIRNKDGHLVLHKAAWSKSIELFRYVKKICIDFLDDGLDAERNTIIACAKKRSDNEDMIQFLNNTCFDVQTESQTVSYICSN